MSEREKCDKKSEEAVDDWENAGDDAIIASVAERQKQLVQNESNLAAEQEQLKIHQKASGNQTEKNRPEVGDGPIRLLRRQRIGNQEHKTEEELEAEAQERATKALEEREVLYQQTRERIFGGEQPSSQQPEPVSSESLQAQLQLHLQQQQQLQQQQSSGQRDHLSDVQMKRADTRKSGQRQPLPQQPPPLNTLPMMMPPTSVPPPPAPWFFNGAPPSQPLYNLPPPQSMYGAPIPPPSQPIYGGPGFPAGMPPPPVPAQFHQYYQAFYQQQQLQGNPRNRYRY